MDQPYGSINKSVFHADHFCLLKCYRIKCTLPTYCICIYSNIYLALKIQSVFQNLETFKARLSD